MGYSWRYGGNTMHKRHFLPLSTTLYAFGNYSRNWSRNENMVREAFCFARFTMFYKTGRQRKRRTWGVDVLLIVTLFKELFPGYNRHCPTTSLNLAWSQIYAGSVTQHYDYFSTFGLYLMLSRRLYGIKVWYYSVLGEEYSEGYSI